MKTTHIITIAISILFGSISYSQALTINEAEKLAENLNAKLSNTSSIQLKQNKAALKLKNINRELDLRANSAIAQDTVKLKNVIESSQEPQRYIGPIYWTYNFESATSFTTSFRANNSGNLFLTFRFPEKDTLKIKSRLNNYSCVHRTADSDPHIVHWSGDKYVSFLLYPKQVNGAIKFSVKGLTLSGKFEREDQLDINKNYSKTLRSILKREFQKVFDELDLQLDTSNGTIWLSDKTGQ